MVNLAKRAGLTAAVTMMLAAGGLSPFPLQAQEMDAPSSDAVTVKTILRQDGTKVVTTTKPDERTAEALTYSGKDTLLQRVVYRLNESNIADSGMVYDGKGRFLYQMRLKLDAAGRVTEETRMDKEGATTGRIVYSWDAKGILVGVKVYDAEGNEVQTGAGKKDEKKRPPRRR